MVQKSVGAPGAPFGTFYLNAGNGNDSVTLNGAGDNWFEAARTLAFGVATDGGEDEVEFETERRSYYVREELGWGRVVAGIKIQTNSEPHINPVDTDVAQTEIQSCCKQEPEIRSAN